MGAEFSEAAALNPKIFRNMRSGWTDTIGNKRLASEHAHKVEAEQIARLRPARSASHHARLVRSDPLLPDASFRLYRLIICRKVCVF